MNIAAGRLEISWKELERSGDTAWRRSGVSRALTDTRSVAIEGGVRPKQPASILESEMAIEGSDKGTLQSGAKRRSICKTRLWGEALGKHPGPKRHVIRLLVRPGDWELGGRGRGGY